MDGSPQSGAFRRNHPMALRCRRVGAVHSIIRVDIAMSGLSSAIHNTGHYHVRPRPVGLPSSCARSANNGHSRCSSCVLTLLNLTTRNACAATKDWTYRLQRTCAESAAGVLGLVFCPIAVWRRIAQGRRQADCRPSDGKIKAAACGTVGRQNRTNRSGSWRSVRESMTACGFAQLIEQSRLCAPRVFRPKLQQARSHDRLARRCRTAAGPSRLALCTTGAAGLRP
jgi:hypothetical protein